MDTRFDRLKKNKLSEFTLEEARGWIIERTYQIESKMDFLIHDFFQPQNSNDFKNIMLNSSVIGFVGKAKILCGTKIITNKEFQKIAGMARIRNTFAHSQVVEHYTLSIGKNSKPPKSQHMFPIMSNNGNVNRKDGMELLKDFWNLDDHMSKVLIEKLK